MNFPAMTFALSMLAAGITLGAALEWSPYRRWALGCCGVCLAAAIYCALEMVK